MTIQQLEYIIALHKHRHFITAAYEAGITQPTLSMMVKKLEEELDVVLFDRTKQPVEPTQIGLAIIEQAQRSLREIRKIREIIENEKGILRGHLRLGIIPTLSPYLVPGIISYFSQQHPSIDLNISEQNTDHLLLALHKDEVDMFIAATPLEEDEFLEIPLFYENFLAYFSPDQPMRDIALTAATMPRENLWVMEEGHCLRSQIFNFCEKDMPHNQSFESGSIDTLIRIVDQNGGYSLIPELHLPYLTPKQQKNIRKIENPPAIREISLVIDRNYMREAMINALADSVKKTIPDHMLDKRLKQFSIRLR